MYYRELEAELVRLSQYTFAIETKHYIMGKFLDYGNSVFPSASFSSASIGASARQNTMSKLM